ncbi:MAG: glycoside hydrolase family 3 protein [Clostridia bacterium]|nr:glycoside hydrolase family 3 protein [Clostridia bacterium]
MSAEKLFNQLDLEDIVGQTLCLSISNKVDPEEIEEIVKKVKPGGIFVCGMTPEKVKFYADMVNKYVKVPVVVTSDVEDGPHTPFEGGATVPNQMALGACDDVELVEKAGRVTAQLCRKGGVHWGFNPVVDMNMNYNCPETNIRAISDKPEHVIKIAGAYVRGLQKDGMMAASVKHFPGQGMDDRNSHFVTTVNKMSKRQWMKTYGKVYKAMFNEGVDAVMIAHGALPAFETEKDEFGYLPATVSKSLLTGLLKEKLGFKGVVVSDAMGMIGVSSRVPLKDLPVRFLQAGGDMILFPKPYDFYSILKAVKDGVLSADRVKDAAKRIMALKEKLHLFEKEDRFKDLEVEGDIAEIALQIAEKSIKILRDMQGAIPAKLEKGSKILLLNIIEPFFNKPPTGKEFSALKEEFERNGMIVDSMDNADYRKVNEIKDNYDLIMINSILSSRNYHGGTMRAGWNSTMTLWDCYALNHPRVIFTSFGDPYKIHDFPYVKTYVNTFSFYAESQIAMAKVVLGQIKAVGKNPIEFKGYFKREV